MGESRRGTPAWYDEPGMTFLPKQIPTAQTSAYLSWLATLSRETLALQIAEGIAWANLMHIGHETPLSLAYYIVTYLEERHDR